MDPSTLFAFAIIYALIALVGVVLTLIIVHVDWKVSGPDRARQSLWGLPVSIFWPVVLAGLILWGAGALLLLALRLDPETRRARRNRREVLR